MKKQLSILLLLLTAVLSSNLYVSAQNGSITVKPKKTTYKRTGADVEDYKKEFTVNYTQISGAASPAVKKKIEDTINYWKVLRAQHETDKNFVLCACYFLVLRNKL